METHRYTRWDESTNSYKIKKEFQNINPEHYLNLLGMAETMIDVLEKTLQQLVDIYIEFKDEYE